MSIIQNGLNDDDLSKFSEEELRAGYEGALRGSIEGLIMAARYLRALERAGADTSEMPLNTFISRIARGLLSPAVMYRFLGNAILLRHVSRLPLDEQQQLADGKPVGLLLTDGQMREFDPSKLQPQEIRQIFAADHVRNKAEQAHWLDLRRAERQLSPSAIVAGVKLDKRRRKLIVEVPATFDVQQLMAFVSELAR